MRYRDTGPIQNAVKLADVPPSKFRRMLKRTFAGGTMVALAWVSGAFWGAPWYVPTTLAMLGAHIWAGQVVNQSVKRAIPLIRELASAIKGNGKATE